MAAEITRERGAEMLAKRIESRLVAQGWTVANYAPELPVADYPAGLAIREYPTEIGPADYALFADRRLLGIVEVKRLIKDPRDALVQAGRRARAIGTPFNFRGIYVPFLYAIGDEEIWFHDIRSTAERPRQLAEFHTPAALTEGLGHDLDAACAKLAATPNANEKLRPYQRQANAAVEKAIAAHTRRMLLTMAAGTGKTFTAVNQVYRLLTAGVVRRVLYLVDRRVRAKEVRQAFAAAGLSTFDEIYEVYGQSIRSIPVSYLLAPDAAKSFVYVCTIQRMAQNLFRKDAVSDDDAEEAEADDAEELNIPVHAFDLVVADECLRGYGSARQSLWQATLDYFDAIKLGLTATPPEYAQSRFGEIVFSYTRQEAVRDGFLVDCNLVVIRSGVKLDSALLEEGEDVELTEAEREQRRREPLENGRPYESAEFERLFTLSGANRNILEEIKNHALEHEARYGRFPKTLIFAVNDAHAEHLVRLARDVFSRGEDFAQKITGTVDRPFQLIEQFRHLQVPAIAVTVDLLATGVDIPDLEFIVFLRPVRSRALFEQMLGCGTRRGMKHPDKSHFVVFDCFGGTLFDAFLKTTDITIERPADPSRSIVAIIEDIWQDRERAYNVRCLVERLHRIDKEMSRDEREALAAYVPDGDLATLARELEQRIAQDFTGVMTLLRSATFQEHVAARDAASNRPDARSAQLDREVRMYHLLVTRDAEAWGRKPSRYRFPRGRFLDPSYPEYTDASIRERFEDLRPETIAELCSLPALFAYEEEVKQPARVGKILSIAREGDSVSITFELDPKEPPIPPDILLEVQPALGILDRELERTHWAIKEVDLMTALHRYVRENKVLPDANRIALRAVRAILDAAEPFEVPVEDSVITVVPQRLPADPWPTGTWGLDEGKDGPWPSPVLYNCSWPGGKTQIVAAAMRGSGRYRDLVAIALSTRRGPQQLVWINIAACLRADEGREVTLEASFALAKRIPDKLKEKQRRTQRSIAVKNLVGRSSLPLVHTSEASMDAFRLTLPEGAVEPSPGEALRKLVHLALLKLPFIANNQADFIEGMPYIDPDRSADTKTSDASFEILLRASAKLTAADRAPRIDVAHLIGGAFTFREMTSARSILEENGIDWSAFRELAHRPEWPDDLASLSGVSSQPLEPTENASAVLRLAQAMSSRRGAGRVRTRDILAMALTRRGVPIVDALLARGLLGEPVGDVRSTRIYVKKTRDPWRLPVEAFTIPTGPLPRDEPAGSFWNALLKAVGENRDLLVAALQPAQQKGLTPAGPIMTRLPDAIFDIVVPGISFLATSAERTEGAVQATAAVAAQAADEGISSVAIPFLGTGAAGLESGEVVDAVMTTLLKGTSRAPSVVVLTTLVESAVSQARFVGGILSTTARASTPAPSDEPPAAPISARSEHSFPGHSSESMKPPDPPHADIAPSPSPGIRAAAASPAKNMPKRAEDNDPKLKGPWARLAIGTGKAELITPEGTAWTRQVPSDWATVEVDLADCKLSIEDALGKLEQWDETVTAAFGDALSTLLFGQPTPAEVRRALTVRAGTTLRLGLELDTAAAVVPWEYLRVDDSFLIEQRISMIRHVDAQGTPVPLRLGKPLQGIAFAWANPKYTDDDDFLDEGHVERMQEALHTVRATVHQIARCSPRTLQEVLQRANVEALHYLGHGAIQSGNRGVLVVHPEAGSDVEYAEIEAREFATWIGNAQAKLVFLGACHSGAVPPRAELTSLAGEITRRTGVPVVAMQVAVPRDFATKFAAEFYARLCEGSDIERAVYLARQVKHRGRHAFGIPVLYADLSAAEPADLPEPPAARWASFEVTPRHTEPPGRAREAWQEAPLPEDARELVNEALKTIEHENPAAEIPVPQGADDTSVRNALRELFRSPRRPDEDKLASALSAQQRVATAPAATPLRVHGPVETLDDQPLEPRWDEIEPKLAEIRSRYALPDELLWRAVGELFAGRHVLFVGPVGTGKTTLAREICAALGKDAHVATASADWTAFEVVGGFFPRVEESGGEARTRMVFRPGAFTEAVLANWQEAPAAEGRTAWRRGAGGTWLLLDEMNRADMDRALGPVFTALETRRLRVPSASFEENAPSTVEIPVPKDFRVLATLNGVDRHYLFRISDALKRRFAFIEVPVTWDFVGEWESIRTRSAGELAPDGPAGDLRRFVYLARAFHPVGTAQLFAAARFLGACEASKLALEVRLVQAIMGSVLPGLEDASAPLLRLLAVWASGDSTLLAGALRSAVLSPADAPAPLAAAAPALVTLRGRLEQLSGDLAAPAAPPGAPEDLAQVVQVIAPVLARRAHGLPTLERKLDEMRRANEGYHVGA
ncbi:DEAD/DEAH box helicase family protein [Sorangium atrum]|uniref:DEAD/DEAH box helicase family protein n=1 Tax=Sorangium atrum TaxID=2995308 RepID=A0ABT5C1J2_9BACT|nr:DEAD/DEAH box helicase family protein [Sorangium aterium]MDC0680281.1 DEAD/DEAH box helicase family protein [Sorangium aterium]